MRRIFACVLAVVVIAGSPVAAQNKGGAEGKAQVDDPSERLVENYWDQMLGGHFGEAIAVAKDLKPADAEGQAMVAAMRASALLGLKREGEARRLISEARKLDTRSSVAARFLFFGGLLTDHYDVSADALDELIARFPDDVRQFELTTMYSFLRNEPKDEDRRNEDRRVQLARIGFGGELHDYFTFRAVQILTERGDMAGAAALLSRIDEPELVENMLIQKRYAALWPKLAELGGPHLAKFRASSVEAIERALAEKPDDHELLQMYIRALGAAARFGDAVKLRSRLPQSSSEMDSADEQIGWAINNLSYVLYRAGRVDEADQLLESLNHAKISDGSWRVSMIINRLEMLTAAGRFDKAAALMAETETSARDNGSDYARQLVRRLKYCTLTRLGRKGEAARIRPDMIAHAKDQLTATIDGLICAGEPDAAEQLILQGLKETDPEKRRDFEDDFVRMMQPVALTSDDPSLWETAWRDMRSRPAIAKEFNRLGRIMPEDLLPPKPNSN